MRQVRNILTVLFWSLLATSVLLAVLFETEVLPTGLWTEYLQAEFLCRCTMEVLTLVAIWLSLRLFKMKRVHADIVARKEEALRKWGIVRLLMIEVPMLLNTLLYYMYMQTTYGYMAIILLLTLPFVYPSMDRCLGDVEEEPAPKEEEGKEA